MKSYTYRHGHGGLRLAYDGEHNLYHGKGRMRDYLRYMRDMAEGTLKVPWKVASTGRVRDVREEIYGGEKDWGWINGGGDIVIGSAEDCERLADRGWSDGVTQVRALARELRNAVPEAESIGPMFKFCEEGDEIDMHRLWDGDDNMWYGMDTGRKPAPRIITLVAPHGGHCGLNNDQLFWIGASTVVLTDLLEKAGYRVRIKCYASADHSSHTSITETLIKESDEHLPMAHIATAMSLAGYFRTVGFRWKANGPRDPGSGYGCPSYIESDRHLRKHAERIGLVDSATVLVHEVRDREACEKEIKRLIKTIESLRQ